MVCQYVLDAYLELPLVLVADLWKILVLMTNILKNTGTHDLWKQKQCTKYHTITILNNEHTFILSYCGTLYNVLHFQQAHTILGLKE